MERKIGEIFEYNGEWYQCINKGFSCTDCDLKGDCSSTYIGACSFRLRKDGKQVRFKKLEKVGEPYRYQGIGIIMVQEYILANTNYIWEYSQDIVVMDCQNGKVAIEIKQNKKDMEEKNNGNTPLNELTDRYVNGSINYDEFEKEVKVLYSCKKEDMEEKKIQHYDCFFDRKPTLKDFDIEAAKTGKPVCTRDGRKARIICFDRKGVDSGNIIALVDDCDKEIIYTYFNDGRYYKDSETFDDLMMLPERKEGWVNVYKRENEYICENECNVFTGIAVYKSEGEAKRNIDKNKIYVNTIKINW